MSQLKELADMRASYREEKAFLKKLKCIDLPPCSMHMVIDDSLAVWEERLLDIAYVIRDHMVMYL